MGIGRFGAVVIGQVLSSAGSELDVEVTRGSKLLSTTPPTLDPVRYQAVRWLHPPGTDHLDEPLEIFAEVGDDNFEIRKVEVFRSRVAYASKKHEMGPTALSPYGIPPVEEIDATPGFEARAITAEEFEAVWERVVAEAGDVPWFESPTDEAHLRLTEEVVASLEQAYDESFVFPFAVELVTDQKMFPGTEETMLVLSHENQGLCTWGLVHSGPDAGQVAVGIANESKSGFTTRYCDDLASFIESRQWDAACLSGANSIQAQTGPIGPGEIKHLSAAYSETATTFAWPAKVNRRFQLGDVRVMVWCDDDRTDWWLSGPTDQIDQQLPTLLAVYPDFSNSAMSHEESAAALLEEHRLGQS